MCVSPAQVSSLGDVSGAVGQLLCFGPASCRLIVEDA